MTRPCEESTDTPICTRHYCDFCRHYSRTCYCRIKRQIVFFTGRCEYFSPRCNDCELDDELEGQTILEDFM